MAIAGGPDTYFTELAALRDDVVGAAEAQRAIIDAAPAERRASARNLIHYLSLRRHDLRDLQAGLACLGVSSLGGVESRVLPTIEAVLRMLHASAAWPQPLGVDAEAFDHGERILTAQTERLLGPRPAGRRVRIMVTMPTDAADDYDFVYQLMHEGMNCMRINCAHGDVAQWGRIVGHLRRAEAALDVKCTLLMDLAGVKLRTGPVAPGPAVLKVRPVRDELGRVTDAAAVQLVASSQPSATPIARRSLPVDPGWLAALEPGDRIRFRDAREAHRRMTVVSVEPGAAWVALADTAYFVPGTILCQQRNDGDRATVVGDLPCLEGALHLQIGDELRLMRDSAPGHDGVRDAAGQVLSPSTISCSLPRALDFVRVGESIWFDDGRFGGAIEQVTAEHVLVRLDHAPHGGGRLTADKGINLPDSHIDLPVLTEKDKRDLAFVVEHADSVGMSFVNSGADVDAVQADIAALGPRRPSLMLKIETRRGFAHLPEIVLAAMASPCFGVMIARGDLAVECGFERLAEVQEEILWICEAAHVPVVWATQVLEGLAKDGQPSRAEITDAAMGHRAECVMLNKGPHIISALRTLDDILRRMDAHQSKKRAMLRKLHVALTV